MQYHPDEKYGRRWSFINFRKDRVSGYTKEEMRWVLRAQGFTNLEARAHLHRIQRAAENNIQL